MLQVAQDTTTKKLHCICKHLSIFGGSEFVPPHLINPVEDFKLFLTLKDNPAVFIAVISLLIFYFTFLMWAKYKDNAAEIQVRCDYIIICNFATDLQESHIFQILRLVSGKVAS